MHVKLDVLIRFAGSVSAPIMTINELRELGIGHNMTVWFLVPQQWLTSCYRNDSKNYTQCIIHIKAWEKERAGLVFVWYSVSADTPS